MTARVVCLSSHRTLVKKRIRVAKMLKSSSKVLHREASIPKHTSLIIRQKTSCDRGSNVCENNIQSPNLLCNDFTSKADASCSPVTFPVEINLRFAAGESDAEQLSPFERTAGNGLGQLVLLNRYETERWRFYVTPLEEGKKKEIKYGNN